MPTSDTPRPFLKSVNCILVRMHPKNFPPSTVRSFQMIVTISELVLLKSHLTIHIKNIIYLEGLSREVMARSRLHRIPGSTPQKRHGRIHPMPVGMRSANWSPCPFLLNHDVTGYKYYTPGQRPTSVHTRRCYCQSPKIVVSSHHHQTVSIVRLQLLCLQVVTQRLCVVAIYHPCAPSFRYEGALR
jgi:hypothetical protein